METKSLVDVDVDVDVEVDVEFIMNLYPLVQLLVSIELIPNILTPSFQPI